MAGATLCAQHGRWLEGERPLRSLIAATVSGRQGRHREVGSGRYAEPEANLRLEEHEPYARLVQPGELARDNEARCDQGLGGVNVARVQGKSTFLPGETCYPADK